MEGSPIATVYYSSRCRHSAQFLSEMDKLPDVAIRVRRLTVEANPFPTAIRTVPAVLTSDNKLFEGQHAFAWLREQKDSALQPYVYECGGPSPNTLFSFVDDAGYGRRQDAFDAFDSDESKGAGSSGQRGAPNPLDAVIEQRRLDVPQPISRT